MADASPSRGGDRMTALDAAFWNLERTGQLLHVGGLYTVEGGLDFARMLDDLAGRLHVIPRYTQRVVPVPLGLAHPTWEPAPRFDIRDHVLRHTLRAPGDDEQLKRLASRLFAAPLDRTKPLWELHLIDGYRGERSAIFAKVHHCMIDGVSGVQLLGVLFDPTPSPTPYPPPPAVAEPPPPATPARQVWRALQDGASAGAALATSVAELARRPADLVAAAQELGTTAWQLAELALAPVPETPFNGHVSILRRIEWATFSLNETKGIKNRLGGTMNDVVLTTIAAALRRYLEERGLVPDRVELRAMCPVNVRTASEHLRLGNRVSMMVAPLPVGIFDAHERFRQVRAATDQLKRAGESVRNERLLAALAWLPVPLQTQLGWLQLVHSPVNTVCTNVPGPPVSLYTQGKRLDAMVAMVPLAQGVGLAFAILSYADTITICASFDPALLRDGERIVEHLQTSFEELRTLAGVERVERQAPVRPERQRRPGGSSSRVA
ncbi:MAG: wax ester/triacylglycerol synthase family O-acyltransferase [bacterium]|nr:wax ester/triacylglycerol synthase family O-acyltransferase [bacterium]